MAPGSQHFLILVNPLAADRTLTIQLYDPETRPAGPSLPRTLHGRGLLFTSVVAPEANLTRLTRPSAP